MHPESHTALRRRAEEMILADDDALSPGEMKRLLHELQVHQIELEMQNAELMRAKYEREEMEALLGTYSELYDLAPVGYFVLEQSGVVRAVNLSGAKLLKKERLYLVGQRLDSFVSVESRPVFHRFLDTVFAGTCKESCELTLLTEGQAPVFVQIEAVVSGAGDECRAVMIDMTGHRLIVEKVRKYAEYYQALIATNLFGFWLLDASGRIEEVDATYCRMSGYSREELLQLTAADLEACESAEEVARHIECISRSGADQFETKHRTKNGRIYDVEVSVAYLPLQRKLLAFFQDISERKMIERELADATISANVANQAKSDFLAMMSHEIRTPLSALLGNIQLLSESQLALHQRQYLKDCQAASRILLHTINDLLDFSKIEAGKLELVTEEFSIVSTCRQLARMFSARAEQKGVSLKLVLSDQLPECVLGDHYRLRQIISNLLSNAIKFTRQGTVSLEAGIDQTSVSPAPDSVALRISVRDTGIGIPEDRQATIFDSFTQLEAFSTRRHTGTGLGLAICKRLVEMMGGTISVSSVPDEGSVFTLSLMFTTCTPSKPTMRAGRIHAIAVTPCSILLADDDEPGRNTIVALLHRRGHLVTAVANGTELLEQLQQKQFDLVISDISMPDLDGLDVVRIIRSGELRGIDPAIPVIALTAHTFQRDVTSFLESGFSGYAGKPVDFKALLLQIEELCNKTQASK